MIVIVGTAWGALATFIADRSSRSAARRSIMKSSPPLHYGAEKHINSPTLDDRWRCGCGAVRYSFAVDLEINLIDLPTDGQFIYNETTVTVCGIISE